MSVTSIEHQQYPQPTAAVAEAVDGQQSGNGGVSNAAVAQSGQTGQSASTTSNSPADKAEVGWLFVQQYYTFLNDQPHRLHLFYAKKSTLTHGVEGETVPSYYGQSQIVERIKEHDFHDCKVMISNMDCQESANGGVFVQVLGEMANKGGPSQKFVQSFFLAQQPRGYYVLNDIFRFLKEDVPSDFGDDVVEQQPPQQQQSPIDTNGSIVPPTAAVEQPTPVAVAHSSSVPAATSAPLSTPVITSTIPAPTVTEPAATALASVAAAPVVNEAPAASTSSESSLFSQSLSAEATAKQTSDKAQALPSAVQEPAADVSVEVPTSSSNPPSSTPTTSAPTRESSASSVPVSWAAMAAKRTAALKQDTTAVTVSPSTSSSTTSPSVVGITAAAASPVSSSSAASVPAPSTASTAPASAHGNGSTGPNGSSNQGPRRIKEYHSAYIKHVTDKVDEKLLKQALQKIGFLTHFEVARQKNCAFVDFIDLPTLKAALAVHELKVGDQLVLIEERKRGGAKNKQGNNNPKKNGGNPKRGPRHED